MDLGYFSVFHLFQNYPVAFHIIVASLSLLVISKASDIAVFGISDYAKRLGLSDYIIGILVVSLASSVPELVSSVNGALIGEGGIIFGTILGSNIVELTIVLGSVAVVSRRMKLECKVLAKTKMDIFILVMLPFILVFDGTISRIDGGILIFAFCAYVLILWKKEGELGKIKKSTSLKSLWKDAFLFIGCLAAIMLASRWLVHASVSIAGDFGVTPFLVALVVIGIGSSVSDASIGIRAALQGHQEVGIGNVLGSNVVKVTLFLGVLALVKPISFPFSSLWVVLGFTVLVTALALYYMSRRLIVWWQGLVLLLIYCSFLVSQWLFG
ncbi:sodium:calcium antiporter [Candidatus Woesearchaeota archaeon]|nr:sodium:calcium antiporter [Candidatus Woesearchaeota archaeon]